MGSRTRSHQALATHVLTYVPGLVLSGTTAFLLGWMMATGKPPAFEITANAAVFVLLAGVSTASLTMPLAIRTRKRVPRRARSIFWRRLAWALLNRFVGGCSLAAGVLASMWVSITTTWLRTTGMVILAVVSLVVSVACWRLGEMGLAGTPQAARTTLRKATSLLRKR